MILKKKNLFKPIYKKLIKLRENIQNREKIIKFKRKKWKQFIKNYKRKIKWYKKFKPQDQTRYLVSKFPNRGTSYQKRFRDTLHSVKKFEFFYGGISRKYMKKQIQLTLSKRRKNEKFTTFFFKLFESRLDTVLYRSKICSSIRNARQLIVHGKTFVNNTIVKSSSYLLKNGDLISIHPKYYKLIENNIRRAQTWPIPPKHLIINYKTMQIIFTELSNTNFSINFPFNLNIEKIIVNYQRQ